MYEAISKTVPEELSCEWDNDGIMCCPDPGHQIGKILLSLDVTDETVRYAVDGCFDAIISHHPLIFHPLKQITSPKIVSLIKNGVCVLSFHTRLDRVDCGVNAVLAEKLGLCDCEKFSAEGIGLIGNLSCEMTTMKFAEHIKNVLKSDSVAYVNPTGKCRRVAVVGGDGKDCFADAVAAGCDTYVTGSFSYNMFADASDMGVCVITAGHFFTENPVLERLKYIIEKIDRQIVCEIYNSNPINII